MTWHVSNNALNDLEPFFGYELWNMDDTSCGGAVKILNPIHYVDSEHKIKEFSRFFQSFLQNWIQWKRFGYHWIIQLMIIHSPKKSESELG